VAGFDDPVLAISLSALAIEGVILAIALGAAWLLPGSPRERLGWMRGRLGVPSVALLAAGLLGLSHALDALLALSGLLERSGLAAFARTLHGARGLPLVVAALAIGFAPALAEELLCRGVLQRSLVARLGAAPGILLAALAFGAIHVEPIHAVFAVPLGVYLGLAGHLAGSVWVPIACHAVNNLTAVGVAAWTGMTVAASPGDVGAGLAVAAAALLIVASRQRGLQPTAGSDDG
jgi:membrane protease YdiL (CAAX protease family)